MTVTFLDPSGLVSLTETIDFTVTNDPPAISVSFGPLAREERAYRDGQFLFPYLLSTKVGTTFHLTRTGGWPADFRVYVDEPTIPAPVPDWGVIYSVDLTNRGSQSISRGSSIVIDGYTWYWKGNGSEPANNASLETEGLHIDASESSDPAIFPAKARFFFPFSQIAGYNPNAPCAVWARGYRTSVSGAAGSFGTWIVGLVNAAASGAVFTTGEMATRLVSGRSADSGNTVDLAISSGSTDNVASVKTGSTPAHNSIAVLAMKVAPTVGYRNITTWSGGFTPPNPQTTPSLITDTIYSSNGAYGLIADAPGSTLGFYYYAVNGGAGAHQHSYLTNVYVMQPMN